MRDWLRLWKILWREICSTLYALCRAHKGRESTLIMHLIVSDSVSYTRSERWTNVVRYMRGARSPSEVLHSLTVEAGKRSLLGGDSIMASRINVSWTVKPLVRGDAAEFSQFVVNIAGTPNPLSASVPISQSSVDLDASGIPDGTYAGEVHVENVDGSKKTDPVSFSVTIATPVVNVPDVVSVNVAL